MRKIHWTMLLQTRSYWVKINFNTIRFNSIITPNLQKSILDYVVTNVHHINMDSPSMVASHVIVMKVDQKVSNVIHLANVHVMTMSKADDAIDAKRTNLTVIKAVWIVPIVIIWFEMLPMIIVRNWPI